MENINEHNFEAFLLDLMEGRLSPEQRELMEKFMKEHPELVPEDMDAYEKIILSPDKEQFVNKEKLLKTGTRFKKIIPETAEMAMIAWYERDLTEEEKEQVRHYADTSEKNKKQLELYGKLFLKPEKDVVFTDKERLYKRKIPFNKITFRKAVSAAAVLLLVVLSVAVKNIIFTKTPTDSAQDEMVMSKKKNIRSESGIRQPDREEGKNIIYADMYEKQIKKESMAEKNISVKEKTISRESENTVKIERESLPAYTPVMLSYTLLPDIDISLKPSCISAIPPVKDEYLPFGQWLAYTMKKGILKEENVRPGEHLTSADLITLGVKGINSLTGWNIRTEQNRDTVSRKTIYTFTSQLIGYSRIRDAK